LNFNPAAKFYFLFFFFKKQSIKNSDEIHQGINKNIGNCGQTGGLLASQHDKVRKKKPDGIKKKKKAPKITEPRYYVIMP
jgi:hypothetical protein